jgi:hypothetical protein
LNDECREVTMMRRRWVLPFSLALLLALPTEVLPYRLKETWHRTFKVEEGVEFILENKNGSIQIDGWDRDEIDVYAEIKIKAPSKTKARKLFKKIHFEVDEKPSMVSIEAVLPKIRQDGFLNIFFGDRTSIAIGYTIKVPHSTNLNLETVNGGIDAKNVKGGFTLRTVNGSIDFRSMWGEGKIRTVNGSIDCIIEDLPGNGSLKLNTVNGCIKLRLPDDADGRFDAKTVNGRVNLDLSLREGIRIKRTSAKGVLGEGGGKFHIRTINGNISLKSF